MTNETDAQPRGRFPDRAQVVIVGGGVIGCSIAYHLALHGWTDVVLLERHSLTAGTTWHAAGLITSAGMIDETSLHMARYSRDLYSRLEAETGHSTGFRAVGHISLASTPQRVEAMRRAAAWQHGFGVPEREITPAEIAEMWPLADVKDIIAGFYVPDEGRADPVGCAVSMAKGARQRGVTVVEAVTVLDLEHQRGHVTAVLTDQGRIETEIVVNAAGMWAGEFGRRSGVHVPLQAAEHYYLISGPVPGMDPDLPVLEDPDRYSYYRPEGDGMMIGLFEPVGKPWHLDGVPPEFAFGTIEPDWDRMAPFLVPALDRIPSLADCGVRLFFCGPESFTSDVRPLLGPAPELDGYWVAAGMNSLGILLGGGVGQLLAHWIVEGVAPLDVTNYCVARVATHETSRRFRAERTPEQLGVIFGDAAWPNWQPTTARGIRRSVLHDRHMAAGAHFGVSCGWEFPEWFAEPTEKWQAQSDFGRPASHRFVAREHHTVRQAVRVLDMSLMAKLMVQGPHAGVVLNRLSANEIDREVGRLVYTQWLDRQGGIVADVTITKLAEDRFMVVSSDITHRQIEPRIRRESRHDEVVVVTDVTSGTTLLSVQGPASRQLLSRLTDADLSNGGFPYLTAQFIHVGYSPVLVARVTYVGELGYELHVPAEHAAGLYDLLLGAGIDLGIRPVGLGAMASLRLEKGYRDMGLDIDNTDTVLAAGLGFAVSWDKPGGFIGQEAMVAARALGAPKDRVVSLFIEDPDAYLFGGEPLLHEGRWIGYLRATAFGHTLGGPVALAQVHNDEGVTASWLAAGGFEVQTPTRRMNAIVQMTPLYDPLRQRIMAEVPVRPNAID